MADLVEVSNLRVTACRAGGEDIGIVHDVSFRIPKGEVLALIGESGSGKTTIALALMGYARSGCGIAGGTVRVGDTNVLSLDRKARMKLRGTRISYVAQSAAAAFNPSRRIIDQVIEAALIHGLMDRAAAETKAVELFRALALPNPNMIGRRYPHQLSGGQLQRLMAAMALITDPELVIFDEPTTALDVTTQIDVLRAFKAAIRDRNTTAVYVSHDLAVVAQMADRIIVLQHGAVKEAGVTAQVLHAPTHAYTRTLMAAARPAPKELPAVAGGAGAPLLEVEGLYAGYGKHDAQGLPQKLILKDIHVRIMPGETLGVIGESGSGKSTLARVIAGLLPPARGSIRLAGEALPPALRQRSLDQLRRVQIVFQNADTALNPAHSVARILARPLELYFGMDKAARRKRVMQLIDLIQLPSALAERRCGELSGGQKQRINLARALAAKPDLILCDEVTSALDTVVGAAILDLLAELRRELNLSYMFISHDISTVRAICDRIAVLYAGTKVEEGDRESFAHPPFHPYTELLIGSVPEMRQGWLEERPVDPRHSGESRNAVLEPALCPFLSRCPMHIEGVCDRTPPPDRAFSRGNVIRCHRREGELQHGIDALRVAEAGH